MSTDTLPWEIARSSHEVQRHYRRMVEAGQSPRMAEMLALQQPPGTKGTERAFTEGKLDGNWMDGLPKRQAEWMSREAKKAGINTVGKFYMSGLADKRGHMDPEAWIDSTDDVKRVARKRNLKVQGLVNVDYTNDAPPPSVGIDPKLERELAKEARKKDPSLTKEKAISQVREKHTPHWKKKK